MVALYKQSNWEDSRWIATGAHCISLKHHSLLNTCSNKWFYMEHVMSVGKLILLEYICTLFFAKIVSSTLRINVFYIIYITLQDAI